MLATKQKKVLSNEITQEIDLFEDYLEMERGFSKQGCESYSFDIKRFFVYLKERGEEPVGLQQSDIMTYSEHLRALALAPGTICRHLSTIREYYRYLVLRGQIKKNPAKNVRGPKMQSYSPRSLTIDEVKNLMETVRQPPDPPPSCKRMGLRDLALLEFLYATGARVSEAIGVRRSDLFHIGKDPVVRLTGKGNKERTVPIANVAWAAIEKYLELSRPNLADGKGGDHLFLTRLGGPFSRMGIWKIIKKYAEMAEIKKQISPHTLRHCFATHLMLGGADLLAIQELLGHADVQTTEIYCHPDIDYLISQHEKYHPREKLGTSFKISVEPTHKIRIRKRGKNWSLYYRWNGKSVEKSSGTDNLKQAEVLRSKMEKELFGDIVNSNTKDKN